MKAKKGMTFMVTFKINEEAHSFSVDPSEHIGHAIKSWRSALSELYSVRKKDVILIERWQEPIKTIESKTVS